MNTDTRTTAQWYAEVPNAVIRRSDLSRVARLIYCYLVGHADRTTGVTREVTLRSLAVAMGVMQDRKGAQKLVPMDHDALIGHLDRLVDADLLHYVVKQGRRTTFTVREPQWVYDRNGEIVAEVESDLEDSDRLDAATADPDASLTIRRGYRPYTRLEVATLANPRLTREARLSYATKASYCDWKGVRATNLGREREAVDMGYRPADAADDSVTGLRTITNHTRALLREGVIRVHQQVREDGTDFGTNVIVMLDAAGVGLDPAVAQGTPEPWRGHRFVTGAAKRAREESAAHLDALCASEPPVEAEDVPVAPEPEIAPQAPATAPWDRDPAPAPIPTDAEIARVQRAMRAMFTDPDADDAPPARTYRTRTA